jgi:DNA modification methylase
MKWSKDFINKVICGDALEIMKLMPDESIDMTITSPPYYGLRDYGKDTNTIYGGNPNCRHNWRTKQTKLEHEYRQGVGSKTVKEKKEKGWHKQLSAFCSKCGAWKGQLGLEPDFNLYIKHLLDIFDEVKRVLKKDGTCWINMGDTYAGGHIGGSIHPKGSSVLKEGQIPQIKKGRPQGKLKGKYKEKCLICIPERFALGMIERGWILRNKIIWHKPNHMPTSVKDRFANSWEYLFFFSKSRKYYFDLDAVREPHKAASIERLYRAISNKHKYIQGAPGQAPHKGINRPRPNRKTKIPVDTAEIYGSPRAKYHREQNMSISQYQFGEGDYLVTNLHSKGKNPDDFFEVTTQPFKEAHFAVFPEKLIERPMKTTPKWICKKCEKPRVRITKGRSSQAFNIRVRDAKKSRIKHTDRKASKHEIENYNEKKYGSEKVELGWTDCGCNAGFEPGIVLDMFAGSGTTGVVAKKFGRRYILIDLKPAYCKMARKRLKNVFCDN